GERYQGVVGLDGDNVATCLENYFQQSEQLPTRLFIRTGEHDGRQCAAGMLLQVLPAQQGNRDDFDHLTQLTATVKGEELFGLPADDVLYRLYHQENVTLYEPQPVTFQCHCSRERCADALMTLSADEVSDILAQDGQIDMHCDYCGSHYLFNAQDINDIRQSSDTPTLH
ncbi:Hsp33 family molecular chaperone HslO, partial [Dickeya chrysanthemi]